jgi:putative transposase
MMPSHLHLLLAPAQSDTLSAISREIKITASKRIHAARKTTGAFWQPRSFDRIIRSRAIFEKALLYLHLNPVEASLTDHPSKWRWSSWLAYNPGGTPIIPIDRIDWPITD